MTDTDALTDRVARLRYELARLVEEAAEVRRQLARALEERGGPGTGAINRVCFNATHKASCSERI